METIINYPNVEKLDEYIYLIKNFINKEEIDKLVEFGNFGDWNAFNYTSGYDTENFWTGKVLPFEKTDCLGLAIKINNQQSSLFYEQYKIVGNSALQKQNVGQGMHVHADNSGLENPQFNNDKTIWGLVLYINDFNGGEIYYPNIGLEYKPNPGDLVIHPASIKYSHGTRPVLEGPKRYIMTSFAKILYFDEN